MSNVIITIRDDGEDNVDVKCEFEPVIAAESEWDDIPLTHKVAMAMMERASSIGGGS